MQASLQDLAGIVNGSVVGDGETSIRGVAGIREAAPGDITFLANRKYASLLGTTRASAVIVGEKIEVASPIPELRVPNADIAFSRIVDHFNGDHHRITRGVHPTALVGRGVKLGPDVSIGAYCVLEEGADIGESTILYPHVFVGHGAKIGASSVVYPMVVIRERCEIGARVILHSGCIVGTDGFGYATVEGRHQKLPQTGIVVLEDDVELGANTTIARARFDKTVVRRGSKLDNLVHVAHNVEIGENAFLMGQVGIAGSAELGKNVTVAGQSGITGHVRIGDAVKIAGQSGVAKNLPPGSVVSGYMATDHKTQLRQMAALRKLPALIEEVKKLRSRVEELEGPRKKKS